MLFCALAPILGIILKLDLNFSISISLTVASFLLISLLVEFFITKSQFRDLSIYLNGEKHLISGAKSSIVVSLEAKNLTRECKFQLRLCPKGKAFFDKKNENMPILDFHLSPETQKETKTIEITPLSRGEIVFESWWVRAELKNTYYKWQISKDFVPLFLIKVFSNSFFLKKTYPPSQYGKWFEKSREPLARPRE